MLATPGGRDGYGMLVGRLCHCPVSATPYLAIRDAYSAPTSVPHGPLPGELSEFRDFWLSVSMKVSAQDQELVGWYHAHPRLGVSFSKSDERMHAAHFPNRWQCALVLSSEGGVHEAGFFQRDAKMGVFRSTPAPFFEVVPDDGLRQEPVRSNVIWANYRADRSVLRTWIEPGHAAFEFVAQGIGNGAGVPGAAENGAVATAAAAIEGAPGVESAERANGDVAGAETGGAPVPPMLLPYRRRRSTTRVLAAFAGVVLAAAALTAAVATDRIDLSVLGRRVGLEFSAPEQTGGMPGNLDNTADGQAGAVPMAHGQDPGAPSAENDPLSIDRRGGLEAVRAEVEALEALLATGEADCEQLTASLLRIEAEASALAATDLATIEPPLEAARRGVAAGCPSP